MGLMSESIGFIETDNMIACISTTLKRKTQTLFIQLILATLTRPALVGLSISVLYMYTLTFS